MAFFASYIGYHTQFGSQPYDVISGRLRGNIVPQITYDDDQIIGKLRRQEEITQVRFNISFVDPGPPMGILIKSGNLAKFWCQQMFGHAYENALHLFNSKFGPNRKLSWPSELQFAYHIRNACFHGNMFSIRSDAISTSIPTIWRGKEITYTDNGKRLAFDFLAMADFICLLHDIKKIL